MQKYLYLIIISFSLSSCYTYQVKKQVDPAADNKQDSKKNTASTTAPQMKNTPAERLNAPQAPAPVNIQEKLASGKNVKIDVEGRSYKVIVDKWESDSLVAHPVHNPKKILKFHKNQINAEKIAEKRFSQPIADIITVVAYAAVGVGIYLIVR
jgi:PBP1b-binding outer membrane lipoprotein LpoB